VRWPGFYTAADRVIYIAGGPALESLGVSDIPGSDRALLWRIAEAMPRERTP